MLDGLADKFQGVFSSLRGKKKLTEENISDSVREVRLALLEADVQYAVVKRFIKEVKAKALGDAVLKSVEPGQQFIKVVHDELVSLMGKEESELALEGAPPVILLCGLQGAGKTTHCAKLAKFLLSKGKVKKPLLAACDLQRPAAVKQLITLGEQIQVPVHGDLQEKKPLQVARSALDRARREGHDLLIVDTAGRLHVDDELMGQLEAIKKLTQPSEVLFVANGATGQDAVNTAKEFDSRIGMTGTILTMLDGDTRGGASISIREVTGKPLKFEGVGEKVGDLQIFNPSSMADRVLGMGDIINLVRKAEQHMDEDQAKQMEEKLRKASFTYEDYLSQMQAVKKMGPLQGLLGMIPGLGSKLSQLNLDEKEMGKVEAIILSMTRGERQGRDDLSMSRRKRIARGSGSRVEDVNRLVKTFKQAKQFFKKMPNMKQMEKLLGGHQWR